MTAYVTSASAVYTTTGATKQVAIPSTVVAGHWMLLGYSGATTGPDSDPAGWTALEPTKASGTCFAKWWWKFATSTDPGSNVVVTAATNAKTALTLTVFSGVLSTAPVATFATRAETVSGTTHADPALTLPSGFNGKIIRALALKDTSTAASSTWTPASGTARATAATAGASQAIGVQSSGSDATSYTAGSWTANAASANAVTLSLALAPVLSTVAGQRGLMTSSDDGRTTTSATSVLTLPASAIAGDTAIVFSSTNRAGVTASPPVGWHTERFDAANVGYLTSYLFSKVLTAADVTAGTVTITWNQSGRVVSTGVVMYGLAAADPIGRTGYLVGTTATLAAPSVSTHDDYAPVVQFTASRTTDGAASVATWPAGWTRQTNVATAFTGTTAVARFTPVRIAGGGTVQVLDKNAAGVIIAGSDTQGFYRSTDKGDHWRVVNKGLGPGGTKWRGCAAIGWSVTEPNTVYACVGTSGGGGGGFLVGTDNGTEVSWALRSNVPDFCGNRGAKPLPVNYPRSSGRLMAQDGTYIFVSTYSKGVMRSANNGATWITATMNGSAPPTATATTGYYARGIAQNPSTPATVYAAFYNYSDSTISLNADAFAGVWKSTNATSATPNFTKLAAQPAGVAGPTVEELRFIGGVLYAACGVRGLYRSTDGGTTWQNLNGTSVDTAGSDWIGIDGYVDGSGNHVVIASANYPTSAAAGIVRLTIPSTYPTSGTITYTPLTGSVKYTIPPENRSWWNAPSGFGILGGTQWAQGFVYVDQTALPTVDVYLSGRSGNWRSLNGGNFEVSNNGEPAFLGRSLAVDPNNKDHLIFGSLDWGAFEITDGVGYDATTGFVLSGLPFAGQGYGMAFDPVDSTIYIGGSDHTTTNDTGQLYYRPPTETNKQAWTNTGFSASGNVPAGVCGLRNATNAATIVVATWGGGVWKGVWNGTTYAWGQKSTAFCLGDVLTAFYEFPVKNVPGTPYVYIYDTNTGVWRSADYGNTWVQVYAITSTDAQACGLALNSAVPGEVWVTNQTGLYRIRNAHTGIVGSGATVTTIRTSTATSSVGIPAVSKDGTKVYVTMQDTGAGAGMLYSTDSGTTWVDAVGDGSLAGPAYQSTRMEVAADDQLFLSGSNAVVHGYPVPVAPASTSAINISVAVASLDVAGVAGSYGGETVSYTGPSTSVGGATEQLYTVECQLTVGGAQRLMYRRSGSTLQPVTLARREGASVVLL